MLICVDILYCARYVILITVLLFALMLQDQTKTCSALKQKIELEESNVDQLDVKIPIQYDHQLRKEAAEHQQQMSSIIAEIKKVCMRCAVLSIAMTCTSLECAV
jgi:hypothetical protein